jgi:prepilin-type N-terminal cleavage/methylation domain-containing protein
MARKRNDDGFTLVELLIGISISAVIVGAIGGAVSAGARSTSTTSLRLGASHDAEISARWFAGDAASTDGDGTHAQHLVVPGSGSCNLPHPAPIATFAWAEQQVDGFGVKTGVVHTAEWVVEGTTTKSLVRENCVVPAVGTATSTHLVMVKNLSGTPTIACKNGANPAAAVSPCVTSDPKSDFAHTVKTVSMVVTTTADPRDTNPAYFFTLTGTLRDLSTPPGGGSAPLVFSAPLITLASSSGLSISGGGGLHIQSGVPIIDSGISVTGSAVFSVATHTYDSVGACTGAGCSGSTRVPLAAAVPDPLLLLPDPPAQTTAVFASTLPCGHYTSAISITTPVTLNPSNIPNCVYVFDRGLKVSGNSGKLLTNSDGALLFFPAGPQAGSFDCSGQANCTLKALSSTTATGVYAVYANIDIFQGRTNTTTMEIDGQGGVNTYNGLIYAPGATVDTSGQGVSLVTSIVSLKLTVSGNGGSTIG